MINFDNRENKIKEVDIFENEEDINKKPTNELLSDDESILSAFRNTVIKKHENKKSVRFVDKKLSKKRMAVDKKYKIYRTNEIYLYSELSDNYKNKNDNSESLKYIQKAYNLSNDLLGANDLTTGQMARKLALLYSSNNNIEEAIKFYEIAYNNFISNKKYLSKLTVSTFRSLCHLYIVTHSDEKLNTLLTDRQQLLFKLDAEIYEIIEVVIETGNTEEAYYLMVDQYDYLYSMYGTNYNYTPLGILFAKIGDKHSALGCLNYSQKYFISIHKTKNERIEKIINKINSAKNKTELQKLFK